MRVLSNKIYYIRGKDLTVIRSSLIIKREIWSSESFARGGKSRSVEEPIPQNRIARLYITARSFARAKEGTEEKNVIA